MHQHQDLCLNEVVLKIRCKIDDASCREFFAESLEIGHSKQPSISVPVFGPGIGKVYVESVYSSVRDSIEDLFSSAAHYVHIAEVAIVNFFYGFFAALSLNLYANEQLLSLLFSVLDQEMPVAATYLDLDGSIRSFFPQETVNIIGHKKLRLPQFSLTLKNRLFSLRD